MVRSIILCASALGAQINAAHAMDGLFIEGGAAAAFVETVDGVGVSTTTAATIDQAFDAGFAIRSAVGYRHGRYAVALEAEHARNGIGRSVSQFPGLSPSTVEQDGVLSRNTLLLSMRYDVAALAAPRLGVDFRPFISAGVGVQRSELNYERRRSNGAILTFKPSIAPVTRSGAGLAIGFKSGLDVVLRYDIAVSPGAEFIGDGASSGVELGFSQIQQSAGISVRYPLAKLWGGDKIAERRRRRGF